MSGLLFPKTEGKKKRKKHSRSIIHAKESRTCYLCMTLHGDWSDKRGLQEHHVFGGPNRDLSEQYGLKVYLCSRHHLAGSGPEAVHGNAEVASMLQAKAQEIFEEQNPDLDFKKLFGKNYSAKMEIVNEKRDIDKILVEKTCKWIERVGSYAVFVDEQCPHGRIVKGVSAVSKYKCVDCEGC